ncbi:MAG: biotin transporter BioY [Eubacterium sp.]|nr:biotin transporter BioY [Eubacterium sp.]
MNETKKQFLTVQDMVLVAVFTALISVCSWITVPAAAGQVPFTLQTFAVFVAAGTLGTKRGTLAVIVYLLIGFVGAPVFAGFTGGLSVLASPTAGYLIGFIFTALIVGFSTKIVKEKNQMTQTVVMAVAMILGAVVYYIFGTIWFMFVTEMNLLSSLSICVVPFIIPNFIKIVVAIIFVNRLKKYVQIFN